MFQALLEVFQGCSVSESLLLHVTHRSYPSRRRACFTKILLDLYFLTDNLLNLRYFVTKTLFTHIFVPNIFC